MPIQNFKHDSYNPVATHFHSPQGAHGYTIGTDSMAMVNADEWRSKLVEKKRYHLVTRYDDREVVFLGFGSEGVPDLPVFRSGNAGLTMMLPWECIDILTPLDE